MAIAVSSAFKIKRLPHRLFGFAGGLVLFGCGAAFAAPVTFNTALPVGKGAFVLRNQLIYSEASRNGTGLSDLRDVALLGYGLSPDLALFGSASWLRRDVDTASGLGREADGLGDVQVFARYTAYRHDFSGGAFRVAPFFGIEFPTGENRKRDSLGQLPPGLQPGSGSVDGLAGAVVSWASLDMNIDGQIFWQENTKANGINKGDVFKADAAFYRRVYPRELSAYTKGFLFGGLEVNYRHEGRTRMNGVIDPDSGGETLFLTPGLQYARRLWMLEGAVQIPVAQSTNGSNLRQDFSVRIGIRINL
ncbi:hypothetical protein JCM17844_21070 [Iodidimonas gelatinilytica]|uniref:Transporter n=1 Tax=Iodidimonas gelatinilytica TaxID=1236966 RepID=A0A5A7MQV0_9PROT|nr:transporter [Iodidimonas gelatinilytica]GEQ98470.1 hypothetical protein JCM17844_21070 [Iodidimonas gelatinilytica]